MLLSRKSGLIGALAVLAVCAAVALVVLLNGDDRTAAAPLPRGSAVTVPDLPPQLAAGTVVRQLNSARKDAGRPALTHSSCLDAIASAAAPTGPAAQTDAAQTISTPTVHPADGACATDVRSGWVSGSDPSGVQMTAAILTRLPSGPSPVLDRSARHVGLALVPQHAGSALTGYALCWAVAP